MFEVAPILLSVGKLIQESNQTLYPNGREIAVNVMPFRQGSFIIDIAIFAQNRLQQLISFVNQAHVEQIKQLLEWIGIISSGTTSLYSLIKFLKGIPKEIQQLSPNEFKYIAQDNTFIIANKEVHQLFQNCNIQAVIYNALGKPLEQEGIIKVETHLENSPDKVVFSKEEARYLKNYSAAEIPVPDVEEIMTNVMKAYLIPKRGSFDGDPQQWLFRMGETTITATIKDEDFLRKCKNGEIRPNHTDVMEANLIQKIKKINGRYDPVSITFEAAKILAYQKLPERFNFLSSSQPETTICK